MSEKVEFYLPEKIDFEVLRPQRIDVNREFKVRYRIKGRNFVVIWGPPFTSGIPHLGTVYAELVKDMLCHLGFSNGRRVQMIPGYDCHGLPTEEAVKRMAGDNLSPRELFLRCHSFARKNSSLQTRFYKSFDIVCNWDRTYFTGDISYVNHVLRNLRRLNDLGKVYKGKKRIDFCTRTNSVISLSEIETRRWKILKGYFNFDLSNGWKAMFYTTTPWSIAANQALAYNPNLNFYLYENPRKELFLASEIDRERFHDWRRVRSVSTLEFKHLHYSHPISGERLYLIEEDWVHGRRAGFVHVAGLYSWVDHETSLRRGLKMIDLFKQNYSFGKIRTDSIDKASKLIVLLLSRSRNVVVTWEEETEQNVHLRTGLRTAPFITEQIFLDVTSPDSKAKVLNYIRSVRWGSREVLKNMMRLVHRRQEDWCISRNRTYNTPLNLEGIYVDLNYRLNNLNSFGLDVWFDSACSISYLYRQVPDLIVEGVDQYKGFFLRTLQLHALLGLGLPARKILTTGFVVDKNGDKLSKSRGGYASVQDLLKRFGSETIRIWTAKSTIGKEIAYSESYLEDCMKELKTLRHYLSFILGYLGSDFKRIDANLLFKEDKWILRRCAQATFDFLRYSNRLDLMSSLKVVQRFMRDLSRFYINNVKSYLYLRGVEDLNKRSTLTVFELLMPNLLFMLRTFTPHTVKKCCLFLGLENMWNLRPNFVGLGFAEESLNVEQAFNLFLSLRPRFESYLSRVKRISGTNFCLSLSDKTKRNLITSLKFFSKWDCRIGLRARFWQERTLCRRCKLNPSQESICSTCLSYGFG